MLRILILRSPTGLDASTQEKEIYVFLVGKYEPQDQQFGVYYYIRYLLKVLFVEDQGQLLCYCFSFFSKDRTSRYQIMQTA